MTVTPGWQDQLVEVLDCDSVLTDSKSTERLSKDYFWYSPVLDSQLKDKRADCVVLIENEAMLESTLRFAVTRRIPVTVRGAGTGNYGQAVPLNGGMVVDLSPMNRLIEMDGDTATVEAGMRLGALEKAARKRGHQLRIYPSTFMQATVAGFVCGGSGGIGSITWGNLWDGNVHEAVVWTLEHHPRRLRVSGDDLKTYIHNYGTTGIISEITIPLAPRREWVQSMVFFDHFEQALQFSHALAREDGVHKRLISSLEWPVPAFFRSASSVIQDGKSLVLLEIDQHDESLARSIVQQFGGSFGYRIPADRYHEGSGISDLSWNHTTLWARKVDERWTYLQCSFAPELVLEQVWKIKQRFGDEVMLHFEWIREGNTVTPSALPLVKFTTKERLYEIIDTFQSWGISIFDPHTYRLDAAGRTDQIKAMAKVKQANDPYGLLNQGKI